ncbi:hypothetical protein BGW42_003928 [Actinomortierella wolfii]|nr:hypothetical protein BGW42_003928 [Actinomortierella wolfii]
MHLIKTLVVLCSVAATLASAASDALVSGAAFAGKDTTNPNAHGHDIFADPQNHAAAVASIVEKSAMMAAFTPASLPPKTLVQAYDGFVAKVSTFPGFYPGQVLDQSLGLNGSVFQFEQAIRNADDHITNLPLIARSLRDLLPGYIPDRSLQKWDLSLVLFEQPAGSDQVSLKLARVTLDIHTDKTHTSIIPKQNARLVIATYSVNSGWIVGNADRLAEMIETRSVDTVIDFFTSPVVPETGALESRLSTPCHKNSWGFQQDILNW